MSDLFIDTKDHSLIIEDYCGDKIITGLTYLQARKQCKQYKLALRRTIIHDGTVIWERAAR